MQNQFYSRKGRNKQIKYSSSQKNQTLNAPRYESQQTADYQTWLTGPGKAVGIAFPTL